MEKETGYHVVLRYNAAAGPNYEGQVTKHRFEDKDEFETWLNGRRNKERVVVEHGISEERAIELCRESQKQKADRLAIFAKETRRATNRADSLMIRLSKDPKILSIFSQPHQGSR